MGVVITATATARPTRQPLSHGARRLADKAAEECLRTVGRHASEIDLLINAGIYRERGLSEPALAALIQEDVHANPGDLAHDAHGTFSFDVDNGACSVLTGVDIARGFLCSGAVRLAMVVTSDSGPDPVHARALPYPEAGGAMLLAVDDAVEGFASLRFSTYPEFARIVEGYWEQQSGRAHARYGGRTGDNRLVVIEREGFRERAAECAAEATAAYLDDHGLPVAGVDLMIATPEPGFADPLADRLGLPHERVLHLGEQLGQVHTTQPVAAVDVARRTGRWRGSRTILFACAGSGITVANALYRH